MDNYMSIFRGILSTEGTFLDVYLDGFDEHNIFGAQNGEANLTQHITSLLTSSGTSFLGVRLLDKYIDNCSVDVLEKKGNLWTSSILKLIQNQKLQYDARIIFQVLDKIIKSSQQAPDWAKSFISTHISKVYECLTNVPLSKSKNALTCIETCLRVYPGPSGSSRGVIERFLWKNIDQVDYNVVQNCGKCLHLLPQIKGGGTQGINHKTQWKIYQLQLLSGIHSVYNEMFANCTEMYEGKIEIEKIPWEMEQVELNPDPVKKAAQMYMRCRNLITYLSIALREQFPVEKPILVKKVLNVVVRGLSVNCLMLERNPIADNIALSILLPQLHVDLLKLLDVIITILRGHLRPHSELILDLMIDALKWTSVKSSQGDGKSLLSLRKKIYDSVSLWCKVFGSGSRCETVAEYLFQEILSDITPTQSELILKVLSGSRKHMSKKARRQLHNAQNDKSNMAKTQIQNRNLKHTVLEKKNQELCISALCCLQEILISVGNFLKPNILKTMQTNITQISAIFYELSRKSDQLYSNKNCRLEIYNALYAIIMTTHHLCPPPAELVLAIISTACARDNSAKVRVRCGSILRNIEKIVHPQKESLLFTIEPRDIRNTFVRMGQENLLREFELNFSNSSSKNNIEENDEDLASRESENVHVLDIPSTENGSNEENQLNNQTSPLDDTNNEVSGATERDEVESVKDHNTDDVNETTTEETFASINNVDLGKESPSPSEQLVGVVVNDTIKEDAVKVNNCDEPVTKKQKLNNGHDGNDKTENPDVIDNTITDEDGIVDEIASYFINELE